MDELKEIYCYNCRFSYLNEVQAYEKYGYYRCDDCDRKSMGWEISEKKAEQIAKRILEEK